MFNVFLHFVVVQSYVTAGQNTLSCSVVDITRPVKGTVSVALIVADVTTKLL